MTIASWVFQRVLTAFITLWVVMTLTFVMLRTLPGGPFDSDRQLPPAVQTALNERFQLDQPVWQQYGGYLARLAHGDLGPSYKYWTRSVNEMVWDGAKVSVQLGWWALLLGSLLGIGAGLWAGQTQHAGVRRLLDFLGVLTLSAPSFMVGGVLVFVFAFSLHWLPAARLASPWHAVLPIVALSLTPFSYALMLVASAVKQVKQETFVQMKRAAGLPELRIFLKHVLKNALTAYVAILGPIAAMLVTGSFATEFLFALPGLGKTFISGVINRDYTLVMGITLFYSVALILFNLATDVLQVWLDPRLGVEAEGK
jgi:oligopeptide transport system permease protein